MYGLNDKEVFSLDGGGRHNFIYGINAAGKSSIANSIINLINKKEYVKRFPFDHDDYSIRLKFDDIDITYNKNVLIQDLQDISKKVFVFNKQFMKECISIDEGVGSSPELGIRVTERKRLLQQSENIVETNIKAIKESLKTQGLPSIGTKVLKKSIFREIFSTTFEKKRNGLFTFLNLNLETDDLVLDLTAEDFMADTIASFKEFQKVIDTINLDLIDILSTKMSHEKYYIHSATDKEFYENAIRYLKQYDGTIHCPICMETQIDVAEIKQAIKQALQIIVTDELISNLTAIYEKLKNVKSILGMEVSRIYDSILRYEYPKHDILEFKNNYKKLTDHYDSYLIHKLNFSIPQKDVQTLDENKKIISEINDQNSSLTTSKFIVEFDKMLEMIFKGDEIRAVSKFENNTILIQLYLKGKEKEEKDLIEYFDILSESQRTKLSLAFFLAVVTYKSTTSKILCIFDDPVDSYDAISKYQISRIIYEFISKKDMFRTYQYDCYSIFLSHSIEYFRLFTNHFVREENKNNHYYILSNGRLTSIDKDHLYLIDGDYNILSRIIKKNPIQFGELISVIPILRELSSYSIKTLGNKTHPLNIDHNAVNELYTFLSNKVIHGFHCNIGFGELQTELNRYIPIHYEERGYDEDQKIFDILALEIQRAKKNFKHRDFYNTILLKNELAIYIRAFYDFIISSILINEVEMFRDQTLDDLKSNPGFWTIGSKIGEIYHDEGAMEKYGNLCAKISKNLTMLNDFAHSAGIYLTPLMDVDLNDLYDMYEDIKNLKKLVDTEILSPV